MTRFTKWALAVAAVIAMSFAMTAPANAYHGGYGGGGASVYFGGPNVGVQVHVPIGRHHGYRRPYYGHPYGYPQYAYSGYGYYPHTYYPPRRHHRWRNHHPRWNNYHPGWRHHGGHHGGRRHHGGNHGGWGRH